MGLVVVAYVCVVGVTGAALVFRPEMQKATFAAIFDPTRVPGAADASAGTIVANLQAAYPPLLVALDEVAFSDPVSGEVIGELGGAASS